MLPLEDFELLRPRTFVEAVAMMEGEGEIRALAGGTDLIPNMKHGLHTPRRLVDLKGLEEGRELDFGGDTYRIGALNTLAELTRHPGVLTHLPALATACGLVAGPQLREMGTLGGNVCLDTRCVYYNQTYFWRKSLGFCLKKDGDVCHVVATGQRCVAAASNDSAPVLMALNAQVLLISPTGERTVPIRDFYIPDGAKNTVIQKAELVRAILIARPADTLLVAYQKLRTRQAIDYPLLSLALAVDRDEAGLVTAITIVLNALGAKPRLLRGLEAVAVGRKLDDDAVIQGLEARVHRQTYPLSSILGDELWRKEMAPVLLRRAIRTLIGEPEAVDLPAPTAV